MTSTRIWSLCLLAGFFFQPVARPIQTGVSTINDQLRLQAATLAYPTAQLSSSASIVIPQTDGSFKTLILKGMSRRQVANGYIYVAGVDVKEDQDKVFVQLNGTSAVPNGSANSKIVMFYANNQGQVTASKVAVLDANAPSTTISDFFWTNIPADGSFPPIRLLYSASYKTPTWVGTVRWALKLNTADMSMQERVPVSFVKSSKDGTVTQDYLKTSRTDPASIQITSASTGNSMQYPCASTCIVDGVTLLNSF